MAHAGQPVSSGFGGYLPRDFVEMWKIGEETGSLDDALARLADFTSDRAQSTFTELARWVPRIIYLLIVVYVAYVILGMYGGTLLSGPALGL